MNRRSKSARVVPAPRALTDDYLREYSKEHLWYEISMMFDTGSTLPGGVTSPRVEFVDNAVLESFAIHLRNLLDFFYPGQQLHHDDVIAAHYFDSGQLPPSFPPKSALLNEAEVRAHKHVSHLTTKRLTGNDPGKAWYVAPLMDEMATLIRRFAATASPQKLHPDFVDSIHGRLGL